MPLITVVVFAFKGMSEVTMHCRCHPTL
jgi:hypothetical protein